MSERKRLFAVILICGSGFAGSWVQAGAPPADVPCGPQSRGLYQVLNRAPAPVGPIADYRAAVSADRDAKPLLQEPVAGPLVPAGGAESGAALPGTG